MKDDLKPLSKSTEVTSFSIVFAFCLKRELYVHTTHGCFVYENATPRLEEQGSVVLQNPTLVYL